MWHHFDLEEVERMLKLESQQKYIYLAATDQGLSLWAQKTAEILKSVHQLYKLNTKIWQYHLILYSCIYQDFNQSIRSPRKDSSHPSIKY